MDEAPDTWYRELSIEFSDGTVETLHIERKDTGTHVAQVREKPKPWTKLEFNKCESCTLPAGMPCCPAALSLQSTMGKLRSRQSIERVKATAVDGAGNSQTIECDLQTVGGNLVQLAVFESACPVGYRLKPFLAGLPPFSSAIPLMRHVTRKILEKNGGDVDVSRQELLETLEPLKEVFRQLLKRLKSDVAQDAGFSPSQDAIPNSVVQVDSISQWFSFKVDALCVEIAAEMKS